MAWMVKLEENFFWKLVGLADFHSSFLLWKKWNMLNFMLCETKCENEMISISWAWDKEKIDACNFWNNAWETLFHTSSFNVS